jgi:SsrA-binding protein
MKIICENRKARYEYEVLETIEAGIVLKGTEIKSVYAHNVNLDGAYVQIYDGQAVMVNCNIEPYKNSNAFNHEPKRNRILLMHKREIAKFAEKAAMKGFTLIPMKMYFNENNKAKISLAICKGRQLHDKRQAIKDKELKKDLNV